jgi:transcription initiation factor TFIIIB Brf1 subunit/transcription initiation factor TFIIB
MRTDEAAVADINRRAEYLKEQTGKRSWASVIVGSDQFLCSHCNHPFTPDEVATAHHYLQKCIGKTSNVPTYEPGAASPVRMNSTAH